MNIRAVEILRRELVEKDERIRNLEKTLRIYRKHSGNLELVFETKS